MPNRPPGYRKPKEKVKYVIRGSPNRPPGYRKPKEKVKYVIRGSPNRPPGYRKPKEKVKYVIFGCPNRPLGYRKPKEKVKYVIRGSPNRPPSYRKPKEKVKYVIRGSPNRPPGYRKPKEKVKYVIRGSPNRPPGYRKPKEKVKYVINTPSIGERQKMKEYKNIIFDMGDVLLSYEWIEALVLAGEPREEAEKLGPKLFSDPLWQELDLGRYPYLDVVEDLAKNNPGHEDCIRKYFTNVEVMPKGRPKVWEQVKRLKDKGYKLYILSNYSEYMFSIHTHNRPFMAWMDGMMVSYMIHVNKPDRGIYEALLDKYKLNPKECLFFDDRKANTDGAIACGINAIQVPTEEILLKELQKL